MKNSLSILFLFLSLSSFGQISEQKIFNGSTYQITYPIEWKLDESGRNRTEFYLFHSPTVGKFGNNINLMIQNLEGMNLNLDSYTELSQRQIETNGKLLSTVRKSKNGLEFHEIIFESNYNSIEIRYLQQYYLKNSKAYILTFTAIKNEYDNIVPKAKEIFETFILN
ncbi:hypothetical protein [Flavobacterium saliperosum]|uniref:PsbP protein n=2 Tax=Flavobacterium saliperosum TaxID=329186 RepID=A0A1G4WAB4_9FLAO|nr:hypothetical protein [Flavobacterium saliperosum]SCX19405.1 hypothetical protein SAMN02927925_02797 [Flavobacterium saliperosum]